MPEFSRAKKIAISILFFSLSLLVLIGTFVLTIAPTGKSLQRAYLGTYLAADAVTTNTTVERDERGKPTADHVFLMLHASFTVADVSYTGTYPLKSWRSGYERDAAEFAKTSYQPGDAVIVYYEPRDPNISVLHAEDETHPVVVFLIFFPGILLALVLMVCGAGALPTKNSPPSQPTTNP